MITNTSPYDYKKRIVIVSELVRLCETCGAHVIPMPPHGLRACSSCKRPGNGVEVWEHMAHIFRRGLMELEVEKAYALAEQIPDIGGSMKLAGL